MTGFEYLRRRARVAYALPFLPVLPGLIAVTVPLVWWDGKNAFVQFCVDYWWPMMGVGSLAMFVLMAIGVRLLLCPFCRFRLAAAGAGPIHFLHATSKVKYCPNCGAGFSQAVPRRGGD